MTTIEIILGIVLVVCALALIVVVLLQDSSDHNMSGVISGGAENIFGKNKAKAVSKKLNIVTTVVAILLVVVVLVFYLQQFIQKPASGSGSGETAAQTETVPESEAPSTIESVPAESGDPVRQRQHRL